MLRNQLYLVKLDGVRRTTILNSASQVLTTAHILLGEENKAPIAKVGWLSKRDNGKAYGSIVIYFTKREDSLKFLREGWMIAGGESATVNIFERSTTPPLCYNCQERGHRAYSCNKPQKCGKCSQLGYSLQECPTEIPKCSLYNSPHITSSGHC